MRKLIIALVVASASLVPGLASSQATAPVASMNDLQADAPSEYTVQKGDTLWAISGKFLKEPWKWPQLWQMNRDQIKNPHLIYPGDTIRLDRSGMSPSLSLVGGTGAAFAEGNVVRLQPRTRVEALSTAVPTIPGSAIGPFLTQPLVVEVGGHGCAPAHRGHGGGARDRRRRKFRLRHRACSRATASTGRSSARAKP